MSTIIARRYDTGSAIRVQVQNDYIKSVVPEDIPESESDNLPFIGPGLFDIQVNGFNGIWFCSDKLTASDVEDVIHSYVQQGVTRCFPTLITTSCEAIEHGLAAIRRARENSQLVRNVVVGCHVEGPFISPVDGPRGAHPREHVRPASVSEFKRWQKAAAGLIRLITLAPEVPNALDFIRQVSSTGVTVSIGHTAASSEIIRLAIDHGARLGTHLGNGCAGMIQRHDNVFWPQLADDRLTCSVIADGWHVPAPMLNCIARCKSSRRILLTSDVSGFGGCQPGRYSTGEVDVEVLADGRIVVAGQTQLLAGSGAATGDCVAHFMSVVERCGEESDSTKVSLAEAWPMASTQPANLMRLPAVTLSEGAPAHLTVFRLDKISGERNETRWKFQPETAVVGGIFSS